MIDLTPACKRTADVLMNVTDDQLNGRTPCKNLSLRDLVAHVGGLAPAFTAAARKEFVEFRIIEDVPPAAAVVRVSLLAALIKFDHFELLIEKATELGVSEIVPFTSTRTEMGLDKAASAAGLVRKETPSLTGRGTPLGDLGTSVTLEDAAFSVPEKALSGPVRTSAGYAVLRVLERKAFEPAAFSAQKAQIVSGLRQQKKNELFQAYLSQARARYLVERRADALKRVMGQGS